MKSNIKYFQTSFKPIPFEESKSTRDKQPVGTLIKGYASTPTRDRYDDVVEPEAFRDSIMKEYRKNPIILFQHNPERPIGTATFMNIEGRGLYIEALIVDKEIEEKIQAGILRAFSIGYIPLEMEFRDEDDKILDPDKDNIWRQGVHRIIKKVDLVENSIVSVPANPDALFTLEKSVKTFFKEMKETNFETKIWEETDNEIRYRIKNPDDFEDDSFRRIIIAKDKPRVFAIIGKLKGETTTTMQSLRFPKDDEWMLTDAKKWVKDHKEDIKKSYLLTQETMDKKTNLLEETKAKEGDECTMDDGTDGEMMMGDDGNMHCQPKKEKSNDDEENTDTKPSEEKPEAEKKPDEKPAEEPKETETPTDETGGEEEGSEKHAEGEPKEPKEGEGDDTEKDFVKAITPENMKAVLQEIVVLRAANAELKASIQELENKLSKTPDKEALMYSQFDHHKKEKTPQKETDAKQGFKSALRSAAI